LILVFYLNFLLFNWSSLHHCRDSIRCVNFEAMENHCTCKKKITFEFNRRGYCLNQFIYFTTSQHFSILIFFHHVRIMATIIMRTFYYIGYLKVGPTSNYLQVHLYYIHSILIDLIIYTIYLT